MNITPKEIEAYCRDHTSPLPPVFDQLREVTFQELHAPQMQVGLLEGRFLGFLVAISNARRVLEFGTYSGFSALAMASALPDEGELITCDIDEKATAVARKFWEMSPHGKKIQLKLGKGTDTLRTLQGPFDLVFIDADKAGYQDYWNLSIPLLRTGGVIVVDNVLWSGQVLNPKEKSDHEIHGFNELAKADSRMEIVMLPVRDGMLLARKK